MMWQQSHRADPFALQILPDDMPAAEFAIGQQALLFADNDNNENQTGTKTVKRL